MQRVVKGLDHRTARVIDRGLRQAVATIIDPSLACTISGLGLSFLIVISFNFDFYNFAKWLR